MSTELKDTLDAVIEKEKTMIDGRLGEFSDLLRVINKAGVWSVNLWVEGSESDDTMKISRDALGLLERAGLVEIVRKYTHRNAYLEAHLTEKGKQLVGKL